MHTLRREPSRELPFLAWKIQAPRLDHRLLSRPRLVARLEAALGRKAPSGEVFLVATPAGYGKSTLIAAFNVRTGEVFSRCRRRTAKGLIAFMDALAEQYPSGTVYIVWV